MEEGESAKQELKNSFPEELLDSAKSTAALYSGFNFEKMNFLEKLGVKKVAKADQLILNQKAIQRFSEEINTRYQPFFLII